MKVLVIRFSSLGDVVLTTALYPNIKAHWPEAEVWVLTQADYVGVFERNPAVDRVLVLKPDRQSFSALAQDVRRLDFDVIIDLQGNLKSWFIRLLSSAKRVVSLDKLTLDRRLLVWFKWNRLRLNKSVRERMLDCLDVLDIPLIHTETQVFAPENLKLGEADGILLPKRLIGIAPGAKHPTKRWTPEGFIAVANRLGDLEDSLIVLLGDRSDRVVSAAIQSRLTAESKDLAGSTSLRDLFFIVSKLSLLITNDSGLLHVAEALKTPVVVIFGPTVRGFGFAPYRRSSRVVEISSLSCRPCSLHGTQSCPLEHHQCMKDVDPHAVLFASSDLMKRSTIAT